MFIQQTLLEMFVSAVWNTRIIQYSNKCDQTLRLLQWLNKQSCWHIYRIRRMKAWKKQLEPRDSLCLARNKIMNSWDDTIFKKSLNALNSQAHNTSNESHSKKTRININYWYTQICMISNSLKLKKAFKPSNADTRKWSREKKSANKVNSE